MAVPYVRRVANIERARSLGRRWRMTAALVAWTVALVVIALMVGRWIPSLPTQFLIGAMLGSTGMVLALGLARFDDARVRGLMAEQFTAETLRKQRRWKVVHNVSFENVDVDSVVVTPKGVLAVETKWRHRTDDLRAKARRGDDLRVARERAGRIHSLLNLAHRLDIAITPVLIVWGSGAPDLPHGHRIADGVWEVDGDHPELWAPRFANGPVDAEAQSAIVRALEKHQQRRAAYERTRQIPLWKEMWSALAAGVRSERDERRVRRSAKTALDREVAAIEA